jgi:hypothetical protein
MMRILADPDPDPQHWFYTFFTLRQPRQRHFLNIWKRRRKATEISLAAAFFVTPPHIVFRLAWLKLRPDWELLFYYTDKRYAHCRKLWRTEQMFQLLDLAGCCRQWINPKQRCWLDSQKHCSKGKTILFNQFRPLILEALCEGVQDHYDEVCMDGDAHRDDMHVE